MEIKEFTLRVFLGVSASRRSSSYVILKIVPIRQLSPVVILAALFLAGCSSSPAPESQESIQQRQDKAIADPMHYSVDMQNTDINNSGDGGYNDKAMKRDLNAAAGNP
jgi:hypothetical protein